MGTVLAWTSPAGEKLIAGEYGFPVTESDLSWIGSSMALGAVFGSPIVGNLVDTVGRKNTMLLLAVPTLVGWGLIVWAESVSAELQSDVNSALLGKLSCYGKSPRIISKDTRGAPGNT